MDTMAVIAKRDYRIVKPGEVYPVTFYAGQEIAEWAVEQATRDGYADSLEGAQAAVAATPADTAAGGADAGDVGDRITSDDAAGGGAPQTTAARVVAVTNKPVEIDVDGKSTKFRKGVKVYDELARRLIDAGDADELAANKAATVPLTK
jgi:hypothetical protein